MKIAFDCTQKRPGCALLQAAHGADLEVLREFPCETWILSPTSDMRVYQVTKEQLTKLVEMAKKAANEKER